MSQKKPQNKAKILLVLFIPLFILFDLTYYLITRTSCLNCAGLFEFLGNSSLSAVIISGAFQAFKKG